MNLEQLIEQQYKLAENDQEKRLDQLVRAGLMPQANLPILKRALLKLNSGMAVQGLERSVLTDFLNSMMYIVLGDDTVFRRARTGARSYSAVTEGEDAMSRKDDAKESILAITKMNESYQQRFDSALEEYGIKSPAELDNEARKQFFKTIDQEYKSGEL